MMTFNYIFVIVIFFNFLKSTKRDMPSYLIDTPIPLNAYAAPTQHSFDQTDPLHVTDDAPMDDEEMQLQDMLFGTTDFLKPTHSDSSIAKKKAVESVRSKNGGDLTVQETADSFGFFIDKGPGEENNATDEDDEPEPLTKKSAWVDEDDAEISVDIKAQNRTRKLRLTEDETKVSGSVYESRLRQQFEKIYPTPSWVSKSKLESTSDDEDSETNSLFKTSHRILKDTKKARILTPEKLLVVRMKDANQMGYSKVICVACTNSLQSVIQSLQFHPTAPVLFTAGLDKTLRIFQIDGKVNSKIQSLYLKDLPIHCAKLTADGSEILMTGRRKYFYSLNIETGTTDRIYGIRGEFAL